MTDCASLFSFQDSRGCKFSTQRGACDISVEKLDEINVKTIKSEACENIEQARKAAAELGYPAIRSRKLLLFAHLHLGTEFPIKPQSCQQASKNNGVDDKDNDE